MTDFQKELTGLLNKHGMDTRCDTPDYILAEYLYACLTKFMRALAARNRWYEGAIIPESPKEAK